MGFVDKYILISMVMIAAVNNNNCSNKKKIKN